MKKLFFTALLLILSSGSLCSQDITGRWNGVLDVMGSQLELVFHIEKTDSGYSATFDSPDQGAKDIPFTSTAYDALSAVEYLLDRKEIDADNIGLIGHSEGGLIAPMVANDSDDVAFIVMLAGTGIPGKEISLRQSRTLTPLDIPDEEAYQQFTEKAIQIASSEGDVSEIKEKLFQHYKDYEQVIRSMTPEGTDIDTFINRQVEASLSPWARFFYNHDPATELRKLSIPVLSLIGTNDVQVPAEMNHPPIKRALEQAGNTHYTVKELEGLNHMFQESETGNIMEYSEIE